VAMKTWFRYGIDDDDDDKLRQYWLLLGPLHLSRAPYHLGEITLGRFHLEIHPPQRPGSAWGWQRHPLGVEIVFGRFASFGWVTCEYRDELNALLNS
jgi:hypothetical protein